MMPNRFHLHHRLHHRILFMLLLAGVMLTIASGTSATLFLEAAAPLPNSGLPNAGLPEAQEIIARMVDAQKNLREWSAAVDMRLTIGSLTIPVSTTIFCRRPDKVALKFIGITIHPPGGFLLPDPLQFQDSSEYAITVINSVLTGSALLYTLNARPLKSKTDQYQWQFVVQAGTWLITKAYVKSETEESEVRVTYYRHSDKCVLPQKLTGTGVLLLRTSLPPGPALWAVDQAGKLGVAYEVTLSEYSINAGLPRKIFD